MMVIADVGTLEAKEKKRKVDWYTISTKYLKYVRFDSWWGPVSFSDLFALQMSISIWNCDEGNKKNSVSRCFL